MKTHWLHKKLRTKCILFFNGWACDEEAVKHLDAENFDVLVCYDYRNIEISDEMERVFENYEQVYLLAWSLGVYVANLLLEERKDLFAKAIAVNGTLHPIDALKGIAPPVFYGTISGLNPENLEKFWRRMCGNKLAFEHFKLHLPKRKIDEQLEELKKLEQVIQNHVLSNSIYHKAVVGNKDRIFVAENQKKAWKTSMVVEEKDVPHYCFNLWNSWDKMIEDLSCE